MMQVILSNSMHPEYGQATIPFPLAQDQYEDCVELLAKLEIGNVMERDCKVEEIQGGLPILKRLEKVAINIGELDYLAKRLDSFDSIEEAQFQAMAVKLGTFDMTDLINLTFCCQQATVITDFSDLDAVGRHHIMSINGGCAPSELAQTDLRMTALKLILSKEGTVTPYGVVYDNCLDLVKEIRKTLKEFQQNEESTHDHCGAPAGADDSYYVFSSGESDSWKMHENTYLKRSF